MADDKKVAKSKFLASLKKNKTASKKAAKEKRPDGILSDEAIAARLGLQFPSPGDKGESVTLEAELSVVAAGFAKDDANRPYYRFAWTIQENSPHTSRGKGLQVSDYFELTEGKSKDGTVYRTVEEAYESLYFAFQGAGIDTEEWSDPDAEAFAAAEALTKEKRTVSLTITSYCSKKGTEGVSFRGSFLEDMAPDDNSDLENDEEETEDTETSDEPDEDSNSDEGGEEEFNPDDWIGGWVDWTDDEGTVRGKVNSYDESDDTFNITDEDGNEYDAASDQCEWSENQGDG